MSVGMVMRVLIIEKARQEGRSMMHVDLDLDLRVRNGAYHVVFEVTQGLRAESYMPFEHYDYVDQAEEAVKVELQDVTKIENEV